MALIKDYELPGTGITIPNAYHVITKVDVEKRMVDLEGPVDNSRPDGRTAGSKQPGKELYWKAGYIGKITVTIWKDAEARAQDKKPIGYMGMNPTDNQHGASIGTQGMDHICKFFIDNDSTDNHITQAYNHLKTTDYYQGAVED